MFKQMFAVLLVSVAFVSIVGATSPKSKVHPATMSSVTADHLKFIQQWSGGSSSKSAFSLKKPSVSLLNEKSSNDQCSTCDMLMIFSSHGCHNEI